MAELISVKNIEDGKEVVWRVTTITATRAKARGRFRTLASFGPKWNTNVVEAERVETEDGRAYVVTVLASKSNIGNRFEDAVQGAADKWQEGIMTAFGERE